LSSVVHVITTIERGGAENQLLILAREQVSLGYQVTVVPLKGDPELMSEFQAAGVDVNVSLLKVYLPLQILRLRKIITGHGIAHAHLPRAEVFTALAKPPKFVFSRHNTEPFFPGAPKFISRVLSRFVSSKAKHCIAISNAVATFGIQENEISSKFPTSVIYYGADRTVVPNANQTNCLREKMSLTEDDIVIGAIGRLAPQKDYTTLLNAFSLAFQSEKKLKLVIIGGGDQKKELQDLAMSLGIEKEITWVGRTSLIRDYLQVFNLFVLTSLYEGFGLVLVEAMLAGVPIIASKNSAIPEVLGERHLGLCVTGSAQDFSNRIIQFQDSAVIERVLKQQADQIIKFDSAEMASQISRLYLRL